MRILNFDGDQFGPGSIHWSLRQYSHSLRRFHLLRPFEDIVKYCTIGPKLMNAQPAYFSPTWIDCFCFNIEELSDFK